MHIFEMHIELENEEKNGVANISIWFIMNIFNSTVQYLSTVSYIAFSTISTSSQIQKKPFPLHLL